MEAGTTRDRRHHKTDTIRHMPHATRSSRRFTESNVNTFGISHSHSDEMPLPHSVYYTQ